ncbi:MAG: flavodoxin family protein [Elusimicrobiales bacterium]|nr:flavodoxin family protein [Elusimicrobiales bacterium]
MDRREFIKGGIAIAAITALSAAGLASGRQEKTPDKTDKNKVQPEKKKSGGTKKMKILVITGSPRRKGNSAILADNFIKGAEEAGHTVFRFDAAFKKVHPCTGCNHCGMDGPCVFNDDFNEVRSNIIDADAVVFASPMYYFGLSAQIKTVIDRFYAINGQIHVSKKTALLMTYADTVAKEAQPIISHYETLINYLGWEDCGRVIASGVWTAGSVKNTKFPEQAYKLGKNI